MGAEGQLARRLSGVEALLGLKPLTVGIDQADQRHRRLADDGGDAGDVVKHRLCGSVQHLVALQGLQPLRLIYGQVGTSPRQEVVDLLHHQLGRHASRQKAVGCGLHRFAAQRCGRHRGRPQQDRQRLQLGVLPQQLRQRHPVDDGPIHIDDQKVWLLSQDGGAGPDGLIRHRELMAIFAQPARDWLDHNGFGMDDENLSLLHRLTLIGKKARRRLLQAALRLLRALLSHCPFLDNAPSAAAAQALPK